MAEEALIETSVVGSEGAESFRESEALENNSFAARY